MGSLRGLVLADWEALGLAGEPDVGDNGVHASASPFEGLAERLNWVGTQLEEDAFGQQLLEAGIPKKWITAGCVDPQVQLDADGTKDSGTGELSAEEFAALRAKTKTAAECSKNMAEQQKAEYGCKTGVAASAVREDSDDSDEEGADFQMGAEGQGALLADY